VENLFDDGVPMGFGMALANNVSALNRFSSLSPQERRRIIDGAHNVRSKMEMQQYVNNL
jgi:hypothetical protein